MIRTITHLEPTREGLKVHRDFWAPPAYAILVHVLELADARLPVMGLPRMVK